MELMIKHSEILTILIQAFMITTVGFILIGCWNELIQDIKGSRKILKKRGERKKYERIHLSKVWVQCMGFGSYSSRYLPEMRNGCRNKARACN